MDYTIGQIIAWLFVVWLADALLFKAMIWSAIDEDFMSIDEEVFHYTKSSKNKVQFLKRFLMWVTPGMGVVTLVIYLIIRFFKFWKNLPDK